MNEASQKARTDELTYVIDAEGTAPFTSPAELMNMVGELNVDEFSKEDLLQGIRLLFLCNGFPRIPGGVLALIAAGEAEWESREDKVYIRITRSDK